MAAIDQTPSFNLLWYIHYAPTVRHSICHFLEILLQRYPDLRCHTNSHFLNLHFAGCQGQNQTSRISSFWSILQLNISSWVSSESLVLTTLPFRQIRHIPQHKILLLAFLKAANFTLFFISIYVKQWRRTRKDKIKKKLFTWNTKIYETFYWLEILPHRVEFHTASWTFLNDNIIYNNLCTMFVGREMYAKRLMTPSGRYYSPLYGNVVPSASSSSKSYRWTQL